MAELDELYDFDSTPHVLIIRGWIMRMHFSFSRRDFLELAGLHEGRICC